MLHAVALSASIQLLKTNLQLDTDFEGASAATELKILACMLIGLLVVGSAERAFGDSGGVLYTFGSPLTTNESKYSLYYTIPSVVETGVKTNFTFYIYITELSGWKYDSERQILTITINTPTATVATQEVNNSVILYEGGRWGPFNVTFDVTDSQVGISPGGETNATAYANLVVYEDYNDPAAPFVHDDGATLKLTDFEISSTRSGPNVVSDRLLASLAVGAMIVAALAGVALTVRRRGQGETNGQIPGGKAGV